jgi:hypothetical protein
VVQIEGIQVPAIFDVVDDEDSSTTRSCPLNGIRGHVTGFEVAAGVIDGECPKASRPPQGPGRVRSRGTRKTRSASPSARTGGAATLAIPTTRPMTSSNLIFTMNLHQFPIDEHLGAF